MSLDYAAEQLRAAVRSLAASEQPLADRLQAAWDQHAQMLWMSPCLTPDLLREFRDLWHRYTAPSDDRRNTTLRALSHDESTRAIHELVGLGRRVTVAAARATGDEKFATLADLSDD